MAVTGASAGERSASRNLIRAAAIGSDDSMVTAGGNMLGRDAGAASAGRPAAAFAACSALDSSPASSTRAMTSGRRNQERQRDRG